MSLPWIKLAADLPDHPKSLHLSAVLRQERAWTHVVQLWLWASKHAPDGDISKHPAHVIEHAAGWRGDPGELVDAMEEVGFLHEATRTLAGWEKHQGAHIRKRERDNAKPTAKQRTPPKPLPNPSQTPLEPLPNPSHGREGDREGEGDGELEEHKGGTCASAPVAAGALPVVSSEQILAGDLDALPKTRLRGSDKWMRVVWERCREGIREIHGPTSGPAKFRDEDAKAIRKMLDGGASPSDVLKAGLGVRYRLEGSEERKPSRCTLHYAARAWEECRDLYESGGATSRGVAAGAEYVPDYSALERELFT
jgi:hypothetical protein